MGLLASIGVYGFKILVPVLFGFMVALRLIKLTCSGISGFRALGYIGSGV